MNYGPFLINESNPFVIVSPRATIDAEHVKVTTDIRVAHAELSELIPFIARACNSHDALVAALETAQVALTDWLHVHAPDMCDPIRNEEAWARVGERGTIAYITGVTEQIRAALKQAQSPVDPVRQ